MKGDSRSLDYSSNSDRHGPGNMPGLRFKSMAMPMPQTQAVGAQYCQWTQFMVRGLGLQERFSSCLAMFPI